MVNHGKMTNHLSFFLLSPAIFDVYLEASAYLVSNDILSKGKNGSAFLLLNQLLCQVPKCYH